MGFGRYGLQNGAWGGLTWVGGRLGGDDGATGACIAVRMAGAEAKMARTAASGMEQSDGWQGVYRRVRIAPVNDFTMVSAHCPVGIPDTKNPGNLVEVSGILSVVPRQNL